LNYPKEEMQIGLQTIYYEVKIKLIRSDSLRTTEALQKCWEMQTKRTHLKHK